MCLYMGKISEAPGNADSPRPPERRRHGRLKGKRISICIPDRAKERWWPGELLFKAMSGRQNSAIEAKMAKMVGLAVISRLRWFLIARSPLSCSSHLHLNHFEAESGYELSPQEVALLSNFLPTKILLLNILWNMYYYLFYSKKGYLESWHCFYLFVIVFPGKNYYFWMVLRINK